MKLYEQLLTRNSCFATGDALNIRGVMVHSTGADNPNLSRYVPGNEEIGFNTGGNHWNQSNAEWKAKFGQPLNKCVHAFIGRLADGSVGVVQTLPWFMRGWHAGLSAGNSRYIGFEICEDGLADPNYFKATYAAAVELTAMLCRMYGLNPLEDGVVICHAEGFKRGVASNHADVLHWWSRFDHTMDMFRWAVAGKILEEDEEVTQEQFDQMMDNWLARRAALPASDWAVKNLKEAVELGITDGTSPGSFATREQVALMVRAAIYAP